MACWLSIGPSCSGGRSGGSERCWFRVANCNCVMCTRSVQCVYRTMAVATDGGAVAAATTIILFASPEQTRESAAKGLAR